MLKRTFTALMTLVAMFCFTVAGEAAASNNWLIYWYVCGTDIESSRIAFQFDTNLMSDDPNAIRLAEPNQHPGDATRCIQEVEDAKLSPNVKIFMQAGGTYVWGHNKFRNLNAKIDTFLTVPKKDEHGKTVMTKTLVDTNGTIGFKNWSLQKNIKLYDNNGKYQGSLYEPVQNGKIGRYLYDKSHRNWVPREQLQITGNRNPNTHGTETDMGSQAGLVSFLRAGQKLEQELYPEGNVRRVLIFVDHGVTYPGGLSGICSDEYTGNSLTLKEIQDAFSEVQGGWINLEGKPFEVVAFDACVMSAYETAMAVKDAANYMVASQEETIGYVMFGYTGLLNDLSKNPGMSGKELGKVICNTYWDDSKEVDKEYKFDSNALLTLSVIDLSEQKMDALKTAYTNFSRDTLSLIQQDPDNFLPTFIRFNKAANQSEKYPAESPAGSFGSIFGNYSTAQFVDLKELAQNTAKNLPELQTASNSLATAVDNAVVYQRRGKSLNQGGGISIFYPFNWLESQGNIASYQNVAASDGLSSQEQGYLYATLYNQITSNLQRVDDKWQIPYESAFNINNLAHVEVNLDENTRTAWVELDEEDRNRIENVRCQVMQVDKYDTNTGRLSGRYIGSDNNINENWQTGKFESTFSGKWIMLDGHAVVSFLVSDSSKRNKGGKKVGGSALYAIPILLNGQRCALLTSCSYPDEKFTIIGARPITSGSQTTLDGLLWSLNKGDVVQPLYGDFNVSEEDMNAIEQFALENYNQSLDQLPPDIKEALLKGYVGFTEGSPFTIGDSPKIAIGNLPDGKYLYSFVFTSPVSSVWSNQPIGFLVKKGKVVLAKSLENPEDINDLKLEQ